MFRKIMFVLAGMAALGLCDQREIRGGELLLVANKGDHTLGIIDPVAGRQIATIQEDGVTGHEVAASADGRRAFVPIFGSGGVGSAGTDGDMIRVMDLAKREIAGTIKFSKGVRPHAPVLNRANGLLYVTTELEKALAIVDPNTLKIVGQVPTGQDESHMLAITADGHRAFTANVGPGTISVLDLENRQVIGIIRVAAKIQRISLSIDDHLVFTSDQGGPRLAVIDADRKAIKNWIPLPGKGYGTAPSPDGQWLLVAIPSATKVAVVDLRSMSVSRTLDVPSTPQEILVRPDGSAAYVSCDASGKVAELDLKEWKVARLIDAGPGADGLAWAAAK